MKKFIKTMVVLAAAVGLMFSFASCASDDDDSTPVVATTSTSPVNGEYKNSSYQPYYYVLEKSGASGMLTIPSTSLTAFEFSYGSSTKPYMVSGTTNVPLNSGKATKVETGASVSTVKNGMVWSGFGTVKFTLTPTSKGYKLSNYSLKLSN